MTSSLRNRFISSRKHSQPITILMLNIERHNLHKDMMPPPYQILGQVVSILEPCRSTEYPLDQFYQAPPASTRSPAPPVSISPPGGSFSPPSGPPPRPLSTGPPPPPIDAGIYYLLSSKVVLLTLFCQVKLGMLPKRPVSLLRDSPQPTRKPDDDDEDELEYVENPFEEHK